ncbi:hypothetical protein B9L19_11810 [Geobacillus thermocatenulatus]|uniref:Uncharacterized protein n=1 Tax=Geobacillus thermocatenulatus TaxID=33938 RepID=A0AA91QM50_9BACL|nr:hypothetical protein B9L19_11810 [Geobacillus thermocatenulatus]
MIKRQKQHLLIDSYEKIDGSSLLYRCHLKLYHFSFLPVISFAAAFLTHFARFAPPRPRRQQ